jgi:sulfur-oxidizing protein SoxA
MLRTGRVRAVLVWLFVLLAIDAKAAETRSFADRADLPRERAVSGFEFLTPETKALQQDAFANPGGLWLDRGERLFAAAENGRSCASCHAADGDRPLRGAAARHPAIDARSGELLNLEGRINACRTRYQRQPVLAYESDDLLALSAYVASLSQGLPRRVRVDGAARSFFEQGRNYFFERKGQLNLACNQCHDDNWGKWLRGERISQGQPTAFPGYRLEWQRLGSLHRRLQDCDAGVRATRLPAGSPTYVNLELYLAWRAAELPSEAPGVRR